MKLAAIYNVWDGLELLEHSIKSIRNQVDVVIVVWQQWSNWGEKNPDTWNHVERLQDSGLMDYRINMEPDPGRMSTQYAMKFETAKRQAGIDKAVELGCTHFIGMDADEFYKEEEFAYGKKYIAQLHKQYHFAVPIRVYYKESTLCLDKLDDTFVPFICPLPATTGLRKTNLLIDPTRRTAETYQQMPVVIMHHMSWVRKNGIQGKLRNSTARKNIYKPELIEEYENAEEGTVLKHIYQGRKLVRVKNEFSIQDETWTKEAV